MECLNSAFITEMFYINFNVLMSGFNIVNSTYFSSEVVNYMRERQWDQQCFCQSCGNLVSTGKRSKSVATKRPCIWISSSSAIPILLVWLMCLSHKVLCALKKCFVNVFKKSYKIIIASSHWSLRNPYLFWWNVNVPYKYSLGIYIFLTQSKHLKILLN